VDDTVDKIFKAYERAGAVYEGFDNMDAEMRYYLSYDFYQQLSWEEESAYWAHRH
jgi:hypothetical protein